MNTGLYLYNAAAARRDEGTLVLGFEAQPEMAALVARNVARNRLRNVAVQNRAVSDRSGRLAFWLTDTDHMCSAEPAFLALAGRPIAGRLDVERVSLDEFCRSRGVGADLIKVDVEGHEAAVLDGASETLRRFTPTLILEFSGTGEVPRLAGRLAGLGYRCLAIERDRAVPCDSVQRLFGPDGVVSRNAVWVARPDHAAILGRPFSP
jgi:FkbM family methyltransferase